MRLPLADNIKPERTGYRLPERSPARLGLYSDQNGSLERLVLRDRDVWRTEVRIGAQTAIEPSMPPEQRDRIHMDTKGLIMRHVYGPIYDELVNVMRDFYDQGIHHGDPAYDRVNRMLDTLGDAFQGRC